MKHIASALVAVSLLMPAAAQAEGFKPSQNCMEVINGATDVDRVMIGAWVIGYLDSVNNSDSLVRFDNAMVVLQNVTKACEANPSVSLIGLVQGSKKNVPDEAGSKANAEQFLSQFLDPAADRAALTASIAPTEADIRAVYAPALADLLIPAYASMFTPGAAIGPKAGQSQVLVWRASTGSLKRGEPALEDFPGGYEDVRPYLQGEFPIVRFKFVEPGETMGMAFDGLIHVNGRWVLMPKPWRVLN